jgi:glutamate:GABA antiporter
VIPGADEKNKALAVAKVLIATAVLVGAGVAVFLIAQRKKARALAQIGA